MAKQAHILSFSEARKRGSSRVVSSSKSQVRPSQSSVQKPSGRTVSTTRSYDETLRSQARLSSRHSHQTQVPDTSRQRGGSAHNARPSVRRSTIQKKPSRMQDVRKKMRSMKAERAFNKTVASKNDTSSSQASQTSRAAVYEMRMGRVHKRSSRMQDSASQSAKKHSFSLSFVMDFITRSRFVSRFAIVLCGIVFATVLIYQPLAQYYGETRQLQQLEAEYSAIESQNEALRSEISYLSTDEGLEEYARYELGLVRSDEHVVEVENLDVDTASSSDEETHTYSIPEGSIATPDTWYSGVLDIIFGYKG